VTIAADGELRFEVLSGKVLPPSVSNVLMVDLLWSRERGAALIVIPPIQYELDRLLMWLYKVLGK